MGILYNHWKEVPIESWKWKNFGPGEPFLACRHCGKFYLEEASMDRLQLARDEFGKPISVNSGHRCPIYNARIGGAPLSRHKLIAFDISIVGYDPLEMLEALQKGGFTTFGFYDTFIHTDIRPNRRWFGNKNAKEKWTKLLTGT